MGEQLQCPQCGSAQIDVCNYESMIVISQTHALFTVRCPQCSAKVSTVQTIPPELYDDVRSAASEVGAGMGRE